MDAIVRAFIPLTSVVFLLFILGVIVKLLGSKKSKSLPYRSKERLLSPAEFDFFLELEKVVGPNQLIFAKVRLWDVIDMERGLDRASRGSAKGKIQSKHVDFVICNAKDSSIRYVIELDDKSHRRPERQDRDDFLKKALEAAGIPLVRYPVKRLFKAQEILETLSPVIKSSAAKV